MRLITVSIVALMASPALAANGQGGLKGGAGQSQDALGVGSVPMNVAGGNVQRVEAETPGNGKTVYLPSNAVANGLNVAAAASGSGSGGGTSSGGASGAGGMGGGGGGAGGLVVDPALIEMALEVPDGLGAIDGEVELDESGEIEDMAPIPVPATLPLLGLALAALPFAARRRSR